MKRPIDFPQIFGVYSRRETASDEEGKPLTSEFRTRVTQRFLDAFPHEMYSMPLMRELRHKLVYLYGKQSPPHKATALEDDFAAFLGSCSDEHFFDFLELAFQSPLIWDAPHHINPSKLVADINLFLRVDDLPFELTDFVTGKGSYEWSMYRGSTFNPRTRIIIDAFPQFISLENDVVHQTIVKPTLTLLGGPNFKVANQEFLEALTDYRKGDYEDCVAKCVSAFESVLKVVCQRKGWAYRETDTADTLLTTVFGKTSLEGF